MNDKIVKLTEDNIQLKKNNEEINEKIAFLVGENKKINDKFILSKKIQILIH